MPKGGKKFDAAEKHFEKKAVALRKDVEYYKNETISLMRQLREEKEAKGKLEFENQYLRQGLEKLSKYYGLTADEVRWIYEKERRGLEATEKFLSLANMFKY